MMMIPEVDVLIVGAGPAGVVAATWMARAGIRTMMIDKKTSHTGVGHADGVEARTFEILDSFGVGEKCWADANRTLEVCIWDQSVDGKLARKSIALNGSPGLSRFHEGTLGQGRIEEELVSLLDRSSVQVLRQTSFLGMDVDTASLEDFDSHCINVRLETRLSDKSLRQHSVKARFLLGCDGASSSVRECMGLKLEGDRKDEAWGVLDCIPITNFPDIRRRSIIRSPSGNVMIIPRERKMCRLYVQLSKEETQRYKATKTRDIVIDAVRSIFGQYEFRTNLIEWCSVYTAGHRVCPSMSIHERIFLAGDAVHTHTAKAGKGMNVSMQDTYNLGWKLASVIHGMANPSILKTYQLERMQIAKRLVSFDRKLYSQVSSTEQDAEPLTRALKDENTTESGMAVVYRPSMITTTCINPLPVSFDLSGAGKPRSVPFAFASSLVTGGRVPSTPLVRQCDARPVDLQKLLPATGQWHLLVFAGDISMPDQMYRVRLLATRISAGAAILSRLTNPPRASHLVGSVKSYLIHSAPRWSIELDQIPSLFLPFDEDYGYDYDRVYGDSEDPNTKTAHQKFRIPQEGCIVLVRPDQHISFVGTLHNIPELESFFAHLA